MDITEVRIKLMEEPGDRLQAFCSITIDGAFVVRDLKIIQGTRGPFVAMPSRKLNDRCSRCGNKNELRAGFCNNCGNKLNQERAMRDQNGRAKLYADIAHPINTECREMIQAKVIESFEEELVKAKLPNYTCRYDDYGESDFAEDFQETDAKPVSSSEGTPEPSSASVPQSTLERRFDQPDAQAKGPHTESEARETAGFDSHDDSFGIGVE